MYNLVLHPPHNAYRESWPSPSCLLFSACSALLLVKKALRSREHSSSRTFLEPSAPSCLFGAPHTTRFTLDWSKAPAHIGQGSKVTNSVVCSRRQDCNVLEAWRRHRSSAWAVGSVVISTRLCAFAITS